MSLPNHFCWTRFGTEAGETMDEILVRKELERKRNGGVFLWGIGNAIGPSLRELLRVESQPEVIFSPIRSAPKREDVVPQAVVVWTAGRDLNGDICSLPSGSRVTSRAGDRGRTTKHYALVCYSDQALKIGKATHKIPMRSLQNLVSANKVGASQVTAVVTYRAGAPAQGPEYPAAFKALLVSPYLLELTLPVAPQGLHRRSSQASERGSAARHGGAPSFCDPET